MTPYQVSCIAKSLKNLAVPSSVQTNYPITPLDVHHKYKQEIYNNHFTLEKARSPKNQKHSPLGDHQKRINISIKCCKSLKSSTSTKLSVSVNYLTCEWSLKFQMASLLLRDESLSFNTFFLTNNQTQRFCISSSNCCHIIKPTRTFWR
jgi:hypothetical protein